MVVSGSYLSDYKSQRNGECDYKYLPSPSSCSHVYAKLDKEKDLQRTQAELADVNQKQKDLAHLKTELDGLRPGFTLICDKLRLFAQIWSSVGPPVKS